MRLIKRLGFKVVTDFYQSIADETLDVNGISTSDLELQNGRTTRTTTSCTAARGYNLQAAAHARKRPPPKRTCSSSTRT